MRHRHEDAPPFVDGAAGAASRVSSSRVRATVRPSSSCTRNASTRLPAGSWNESGFGGSGKDVSPSPGDEIHHAIAGHEREAEPLLSGTGHTGRGRQRCAVDAVLVVESRDEPIQGAHSAIRSIVKRNGNRARTLSNAPASYAVMRSASPGAVQR